MDTTMLTTLNSETACEIACTHKVYGSGKITKLKCSEYQGKPEIFMTFESATKTVTLAFSIVSVRELLAFDETDQETLDCLMAEYGANWFEMDQKRKEEERARKEAARLQREQEQQEAEAKKKVEQTLARLDRLKPEDLSTIFKTPQTEYEMIGWMAKHIKSIKPSMPEECKSWFESKFGPVECATVYKRGAKTSGNNPMKYTLSIHGTFDVEVPSVLTIKATEKNKKAIDSVEFFWTLVDKYGFQFGKKQDVDEIRKFVPATYLTEFEAGFAM